MRTDRVDLPRERLHALGSAALTAAELLALLVDGRGGAGAEELGRRLLTGAGGLGGLARRSAGEWAREPGLGVAASCRLAAAFEVARRMPGERLRRGAAIRSGADVCALVAPRLRYARKERFVALLLDARHRLLRLERVSEGTLTSSVVHPREVFGPALREGAAAVVVAHNHPSGDPTPSTEDREVTLRLAEAGRLVGVSLLDHVVVGDPGFVSFRERGDLPEPFGER